MFGTNALMKLDKGDGSTLIVQEIFHTIQGEGPFTGVPAVFIRLAGCHLACHFCDTDFESNATLMHVKDVVEAVKRVIPTSETLENNRKTHLVVLTGGEPLRQNVTLLCRHLCFVEKMAVQIETSGTFWWPELSGLLNDFDDPTRGLHIVCSPKTGKVHPTLANICRHWKYVIKKQDELSVDGLPNYSTQNPHIRVPLARPPGFSSNAESNVGTAISCKRTIWIQPCEEYTVTLDSNNNQQVTSAVKDSVKSRDNVNAALNIVMKHGYRLSLQTHKIVGLP